MAPPPTTTATATATAESKFHLPVIDTTLSHLHLRLPAFCHFISKVENECTAGWEMGLWFGSVRHLFFGSDVGILSF
jgi:hypothetical protein